LLSGGEGKRCETARNRDLRSPIPASRLEQDRTPAAWSAFHPACAASKTVAGEGTMRERDWLCPVLAGLVSLGSLGVARLHGQEGKQRLIEFNRHIRPILSDNCFACHGPDKNQRKADLRLDVESDAFADRGGYAALVKGKPEASELFKRITRND